MKGKIKKLILFKHQSKSLMQNHKHQLEDLNNPNSLNNQKRRKLSLNHLHYLKSRLKINPLSLFHYNLSPYKFYLSLHLHCQIIKVETHWFQKNNNTLMPNPYLLSKRNKLLISLLRKIMKSFLKMSNFHFEKIFLTMFNKFL